MAYALDDSWDNCAPVARAGNACFGLYARCGIWVARNLTDGFVPGEIAAAYGSPEQTRKLVDVGLWEAAEGGYRVVHYLERNPTAEKVKGLRAGAARRQALVRDPALREAVRARDADRCRYCGVAVRWSDRKGGKGGTYDPVDPDGPTTVENVVVCCRACSSRKGSRTPAEAGMKLRPAVNLDTYPESHQNEPESNQVSSSPHIPPKGEGAGRPPNGGVAPVVPLRARTGDCPKHQGQSAHNCGPCRSERIGHDDAPQVDFR